MNDGSDVWFLACGGTSFSDCNVFINNARVVSDVPVVAGDTSRVYVGGIAGFVDRCVSGGNSVQLTGTFDVSGSGVVSCGGLFGQVHLQAFDQSIVMSDNAKIDVVADYDCYLGGVAGQTSPDTWANGFIPVPHMISNSSASGGFLRAVSNKGGHVFCGGIAGWSDGGFGNIGYVGGFELRNDILGAGVITCVGGLFGGGVEFGAYNGSNGIPEAGIPDVSGGLNTSILRNVYVHSSNDSYVGGIAGVVELWRQDVGRSSSTSEERCAYTYPECYRPVLFGCIDSHVEWNGDPIVVICSRRSFIAGLIGRAEDTVAFGNTALVDETMLGNMTLICKGTTIAESVWDGDRWVYSNPTGEPNAISRLRSVLNYTGDSLKFNLYLRVSEGDYLDDATS